MNQNPLSQSVEQFANALATIPDPALDRPWAWQSYNSEGVRFAFFRTYEELRQLAVELLQRRDQINAPLSAAQSILGQYHAAFRDLQAALLGLTPAQMDQSPAENEWPVRQVIAHILSSDIGFYVVTRFAQDTLRQGQTEPQQIPEEAWDRLAGLDEAAYTALMKAPIEELLAHLQTNHDRVIANFSTLSAEELEGLSYYWEEEPYSLRFRLHRFDSHMRQHTIQVDKTLVALGMLPNEARRLLRLIYSALAGAEGALIGFEQPIPGEVVAVARSIDARRAELEAIVKAGSV